MRQARPAQEVAPHLADAPQAQPVQLEPKRRNAAVFLIEGHPPETHAVADRRRQLVGRDPPLGPVDQLIGNARFPAPIPVLGPALGQVQIAGQHAGERILRVVVGVQQVLTDHAILRLAHFPAPLPLDARRLLTLLDMARRVDHRDRVLTGVPVHHLLLHQPVHTLMVPFEDRQELLKRPHRYASRQGNGLDALTLQVGQQPQQVTLPMGEGRGLDKTRPKRLQQRSQLRLQ